MSWNVGDANMKKYKPNSAPDPVEWLAMDEQERMMLVTKYHKKTNTPMPEMHTIVHVIVENQLAEGLEVVHWTLHNLMDEGLDRHEAIPAIGSVVINHLMEIIRGENTEGFSNERYERDLESLTIEKWYQNTDPGEE
jgi:hypothetical protein